MPSTMQIDPTSNTLGKDNPIQTYQPAYESPKKFSFLSGTCTFSTTSTTIYVLSSSSKTTTTPSKTKYFQQTTIPTWTEPTNRIIPIPQGYHNYNQQQTQRNQHYISPLRPIAQKPQPKPEPMDIDPSIRINAINYANRPNLKYARKRQPDSNLSNPPMKAQRNFHNGFDNYNFRPPLPPRNYPKSPQFYPELAHLAQPQQRFMSYQVAQRPQLHPQRPNIFNRPQYQHGPNQPTGLYQYSQGYHNYNQQQTKRNQHYNPPPRLIAQKPQPKPEPMDIDPSIRINAINYANRPNLKYARKRQPDSNLSNPPMKAQRNFHNGFDNYNFRPPLPPRNYPKSPQFYPELAHLAQPQQRFMSYQVAQRPQLHPQRPNIFNRPQYQHGPNQPTGLYQYSQGYHNYNQQQTQRNQHYNPPPRLIAQKPQPKPEPMDIDPSIRINAINYANRPNLKYARKRQPDSNLSNPPMKAQRNFHNGFDNYNFRPPLPPRNYPKSPQFYPELAHLAQPQQRFMSYQVAQRPQLHPQRPNIFNRPQYQHGPNQPTGLYQYSQGYHNYNQQQTQRNQHYNPPPRLIAQKPQPKPEPMDIDPSIRINAINYANRPNLKYARKRQPDSNLSNPPMKAQRNFHNGFDNYNFRPPLPPRNYPKSPQFYPELAHLAQPQQRFMSYQVAQRPQLHPQRPNIFNRPQYQHGPNQPTGLYQYSQGYHNYNQQQTQRNQHYNPPPRLIAQKPQPKPEPMDIDPSIRINAINYANRPNLKYARKRQPDSNLSNPPMKAQRNFHNGFDNYNFRPPLPPRNYPKSPQFYPELAHLAQPQQRFMSYQVAQRPQLHPQRPNIFNRPQYQHGPNQPTGLYQYSQGYHNYNQQQTQRNQHYNPPPRLIAQKPQPKPEPMDIDPSIRINAINYANRPNLKYARKRQPDSNLSNPPMKAQRNFHNGFDNYNFRPPLPPRNYPKSPQFYPELAHLAQPQQRFMSYQVAQRPQLHPQRPNIFNRPQYQHGPNQPTGLYQYSQGYHNYNQQQTQRNQHYNPPPRLIAQKPQPKPEPMDIDPSIRINAINYANRPNLKYARKRQPDSNLSNPPMKAQRNFMSTHANQQNGFDNYNFRPPLPPRNYPKSPQFYPELAHLAQPQQRFMSYQVAQRPQLHPQRPNIFNRPQYQHGPNQPTGLYQYSQGYHNYNQQQTQRNQHYNPPPRLIAQKPQPKPEPMDIDPSIRINAINYANRPNLKYARKRQPDSNLSNPPMKAQRNFHVNISPEEAETSFDNKDNTPPITFEKYGVENPDYYPYNYENAYFTDIQFLE
ncbi:unnamed protein product [Ceratitis capitata]|uniref:(Mediterranean fruit fly) hypothetical protein n=1 Tax=Ceratitis capitata TaxID=7213 RepID=A0A811UQQ1_CERCA|nr:unnamed protein product [Ceratitis capitata]